MSEQDKKHALATALGIGVVVLLFLIMRGNSNAATTNPDAPSSIAQTPQPSYMNYNVPAFSPDLGNIIPPSQQAVWGQPAGATSGGCGCGTQSGCDSGTPGMVGTVEQFGAMMGQYAP